MIVPHVSGDNSQYLRKDDVKVYHRQGLTDCPWCGFESADPEDTHSMEEYDIWFRTPQIKEVVLNNTYYKMGCCVIVSSCPKCKKLSWVHRKLDTMSELFFHHSWQDENRVKALSEPLDKNAIWGEMHRRGMESVQEMFSAICHNCVHFRGIIKTFDSFWYHKMVCARDGRERERSIGHFQKPDDCNAFRNSGESTT